MIYIYPNTLSIIITDDQNALANGYIPITEDIYEGLKEGLYEWSDGKIIPATRATKKRIEQADQRRELLRTIAEAKAELAKLDVKSFKYWDGYLTDKEYAPYKKRKQELREVINEVEAELAKR